MYQDDHNASPFNALPPIVVVFTLAIVGIELAFQAAEYGLIGGADAVGWRLAALHDYAFFGSVLDWMMANQSYPIELLWRFVTYPFVHGSFTQTAFAAVMLLAIGKMVAEVYSTLAFLVIFFASTLIGALAYGVFLDTNAPLFGAFPAVYGMIGALTFMLWVRAKYEGSNQYQAFSLIGFLMGIQLFFKLVFGGGNDWVADIAGFLTGFVLSFVLAPGGASRISELLNQIRRRR